MLWSAVFITISTLYRPIEQLLSRHISERLERGEAVSQPMRVAATIQFGLSLFFAVVALVLRSPIQNGLLEGNETLYWVFFSAVLFYAASYFARGFLAGNQRFGLFVALILSESVLQDDVRGAGRGQPAERPVGGGDRDRRRARRLSLMVVPLCLRAAGEDTRRPMPQRRRRLAKRGRKEGVLVRPRAAASRPPCC